MSSLPSSYPTLSLHLTDSTLTPLVSSATTSTSHPTSQSDALSSLTTASLGAYTSAARLGLGLPQRIMLEARSSSTRSSPIILHSFLSPQSQARLSPRQDPDSHSALLEETRGGLRPLSASTDADTDVAGSGSQFGGSDSSDTLPKLRRPGHGRTVTNGLDKGKGIDTGAQTDEASDEDESSVSLAPLLISTVVSRDRSQLAEARRAAGGLERIGIRFQKEWVREQDATREEQRADEEDDG
jgi:hypothetical protein